MYSLETVKNGTIDVAYVNCKIGFGAIVATIHGSSVPAPRRAVGSVEQVFCIG